MPKWKKLQNNDSFKLQRRNQSNSVRFLTTPALAQGLQYQGTGDIGLKKSPDRSGLLPQI